MSDARLTGLFLGLGVGSMLSLAVVLPTSPRPGPRLASLDVTVPETSSAECVFVRVSSILAGSVGVDADPRLTDLAALRTPDLRALGPMHLIDLDDGVACAGATHHSRLVTGQKLAVHVERTWGGRHRVLATLGHDDVAIEVGRGEPIVIAGRTFAGADLVVVVRLGHASPERP